MIFPFNNILFSLTFAGLILLYINSCGSVKVEDDDSSTSSSSTTTSCYDTTPSEKGSCSFTSSLSASTRVPLLLVRVQYKDACFTSDETTWASKLFGTSEGQTRYCNRAF